MFDKLHDNMDNFRVFFIILHAAATFFTETTISNELLLC